MVCVIDRHGTKFWKCADTSSQTLPLLKTPTRHFAVVQDIPVHYVGDPTHKPSFFILSKAMLHALGVNAYPSKIRDFLGVVDFLLCLGLRPHLGHMLFSPKNLW